MKVFSSILALVLSTAAFAENNNPRTERPLRKDISGKAGLIGEEYYVSPDALQLVGPVFFNAIELAGRITEKIGTGTKTIQLIINSPGGSVQAGEMLMGAMDMARKSGIDVECIVVGAAYSMGFNTLGSCSRVYATPSATFLFHPVKAGVSQPLRAIDALQLAQALNDVDVKYLGIAQRLTHLDDEALKFNYYSETMWTMESLKTAHADGFIIPVAVVVGLPSEALHYPGRDQFERAKRTPSDSRNIRVYLEN